MKTLQEIFNVVIEGGFYKNTPKGRYMCIALKEANRLGAITDKERHKARSSVWKYLRYLEKYVQYKYLRVEVCSVSLSSAFYLLGYDRPKSRKRKKPTTGSQFDLTKSVYMNWANRPRFNR